MTYPSAHMNHMTLSSHLLVNIGKLIIIIFTHPTNTTSSLGYMLTDKSEISLLVSIKMGAYRTLVSPLAIPSSTSVQMGGM